MSVWETPNKILRRCVTSQIVFILFIHKKNTMSYFKKYKVELFECDKWAHQLYYYQQRMRSNSSSEDRGRNWRSGNVLIQQKAVKEVRIRGRGDFHSLFVVKSSVGLLCTRTDKNTLIVSRLEQSNSCGSVWQSLKKATCSTYAAESNILFCFQIGFTLFPFIFPRMPPRIISCLA